MHHIEHIFNAPQEQQKITSHSELVCTVSPPVPPHTHTQYIFMPPGLMQVTSGDAAYPIVWSNI